MRPDRRREFKAAGSVGLVAGRRAGMNPEVFAGLAEGAIPLLGGLYGTLIGHRIIGKQPGEDYKYDLWHKQFGTMLKLLGPFMVLFGLFLMARGFVGVP
jgi:hypothetical protein